MATIHQKFLTNNLRWILSKTLHNTLKHTPPPNNRIFTCSTSLSSSLSKKLNTRFSFSTYTNTDHYEYEKGLIGNGQQYLRPIEVPWKKELCNSVQFIGHVGTPVEFKLLSSGKVLAWCRLAVRVSATDTTWIKLTFFDKIAHIAFQHVEKGQQISVSGWLASDTVDSDDGKHQTYYKVVVEELKFVERSLSSAETNDGNFNYNSNSGSMTTGRKQNNYAANGTRSREELWQAFFASPGDWWDNRKYKTSPNHPDFKHKDTGEALWVEGRLNPSWVKSQLSELDSRMEYFHD